MRHRINNLYVLGFGLFWLFSCGQASRGGKATDSTTTRKDTVRLETAIIDQSMHMAEDKAFPRGFMELRDAFVKDSGGYNADRHIRKGLLAPYLTEDFDSAYPSTYTPLQMIENDSGYFFILRENCFAGGDCAYYYLLVFGRDGQIVRHLELGQLTAEEDEITDFSYRLIGDSVLVGKETDNQLEKGKVDSTMKWIRLVP